MSGDATRGVRRRAAVLWGLLLMALLGQRVYSLSDVPQARANGRRFHLGQDCSAIPEGAVLETTDKPYSAARCPACAK